MSDLQELRGEIIGLAFELGEPHLVDYSVYGDIDNWDSDASDRYYHLIRMVREKKDAWCKQQALMAELQWASIPDYELPSWNVTESAPVEPETPCTPDDLFPEPEQQEADSPQSRRGRKPVVIDWPLAARMYWSLKSELENRKDYRSPSISEVCDRLTSSGNRVSEKTFRNRLGDDGMTWPPAEPNEDHLAA